MIAADTSSLVAYFAGAAGPDVEAVDRALAGQVLLLPPVVLTEMLSDSKLPGELRTVLGALPLLDLTPGYWARAGVLRAKLLVKRMKARVADALIAQSCIDHGVSLITRDADFRHFEKCAGLKLE